jgi:hypothetical protein
MVFCFNALQRLRSILYVDPPNLLYEANFPRGKRPEHNADVMLKVQKAEALFRLVAAWFGRAAGVYVQIFVILAVMCMLLYVVWTKLKVNLEARFFPYVCPSAYIISEIRNFDCICNLWVWDKICLPRLVLDSFGRVLTTFYLKLKSEFVDLFLSWTAHRKISWYAS